MFCQGVCPRLHFYCIIIYTVSLPPGVLHPPPGGRGGDHFWLSEVSRRLFIMGSATAGSLLSNFITAGVVCSDLSAASVKHSSSKKKLVQGCIWSVSIPRSTWCTLESLHLQGGRSGLASRPALLFAHLEKQNRRVRSSSTVRKIKCLYLTCSDLKLSTLCGCNCSESKQLIFLSPCLLKVT